MVGGIPECVGPDCGLLVEPKRADQVSDALVRLLGDERLLTEMGKQARSKAVNLFDWKVAASRTLSAFMDLARQHRA